MLVVGITGGIGSGKSTAADRFSKLGVPVIDADVVAREVVKPGQPACNKVIETFGEEVANEDGGLNRAKLRQIVFADAVKKAELENILHPIIHAEILQQLSHLTATYAIVVIPLLAESKREYPLDRILVVDIPPELQLDRVSVRDQQSAEQIQRIIDLQASRQERLAIADDVISNAGTTEDLLISVDELHKKYLKIAQSSDRSEHA